ncbi:hypothetical protein QOZ80_2BG0190390 [Eleusine coracana subsp. coracana]|nr:hypothetical protein QOZ80_2BG0190390 [Eleusine coracana subsp. coracana]
MGSSPRHAVQPLRLRLALRRPPLLPRPVPLPPRPNLRPVVAFFAVEEEQVKAASPSPRSKSWWRLEGWQPPDPADLPFFVWAVSIDVDCHTKISLNSAQNPHVKDKQKDMPKMIGTIRAALKSITDGEINISAYDTAWVALVRNTDGDDPQFPLCIDWIIRNQLADGSWGDKEYFLVQDRIINTLACIIALKSWNIHHDKYKKGMLFIHENLRRLTEEDEDWMLIGFEITFPALLEIAKNLGLNLPFDEPALQMIYAKREQKLSRIPKDLLHVAPTTLLLSIEGMQNLDWKRLLKLQCSDGSFMSSPAPTAYALMQTGDKKCFQFLDKIIHKFNGGGTGLEKACQLQGIALSMTSMTQPWVSVSSGCMVAFPGEDELQRASSYSHTFLEERRASGKLNDKWVIAKDLPGEVGYVLNFPWKVSLPRIETRMYLEQYGGSDDVWIGKVLYRMSLVSNDQFLGLAKADFSNFQRCCRLEWQSLKKWFDKNNIEVFGLTLERALRAYFLAAVNIFEPNRAAERLAWARTLVVAEAVSWHLQYNCCNDIKKERLIRKLENHDHNKLTRGHDDRMEKDLQCALREIINQAIDDNASFDLHEVWKQWLRSLTSKDSRESCEEYRHLERLTSSICSKLASRVFAQSAVNMDNIENEVDLEMQELIQCVLQSCNSINKVTRLTFFHVVKSFYYVAHSSPETIDSHISKVIFEDVI